MKLTMFLRRIVFPGKKISFEFFVILFYLTSYRKKATKAPAKAKIV